MKKKPVNNKNCPPQTMNEMRDDLERLERTSEKLAAEIVILHSHLGELSEQGEAEKQPSDVSET